MREKLNHTKGPWHWGSPHNALNGEFGQVICWAANERPGDWQAKPEEEKANQKLLAASPDMYAALRWVRTELLTSFGGESQMPSFEKSLYLKVEAALNRAERGVFA